MIVVPSRRGTGWTEGRVHQAGLPIAARDRYSPFLSIASLAAQEDVPGSRDHPMFSRMAGFYFTIIEKGEVHQEVTASWLLDEVVSLLRDNPDLRRRVEGHTDDVGSDQANLELSRRRAAAVVQALTARGVASSRLASAGYGESRRMADNATEEGRARNRRVELVRM